MRFDVHRSTSKEWKVVGGAKTKKQAIKIAESFARKEPGIRFGVWDNKSEHYIGFANAAWL